MAGNLNVLKYLIEIREYNPSGLDEDSTPLFIAAANGHLQVVKYLVNEAKCDTMAKSTLEYKLPIHFAALGKEIEVIKFLEKYNHVLAVDRNGQSCLHIAAMKGHLHTVRYLIEEHLFDLDTDDFSGVTPLHLASWQGQLDVVSYLIKRGSNVLCCDKAWDTPLHWAASEGQLEVIQFLIEEIGIDSYMDVKGENDQTPLEYAIFYEHASVAEYLTYLVTNNRLPQEKISGMPLTSPSGEHSKTKTAISKNCLSSTHEKPSTTTSVISENSFPGRESKLVHLLSPSETILGRL